MQSLKELQVGENVVVENRGAPGISFVIVSADRSERQPRHSLQAGSPSPDVSMITSSDSSFALFNAGELPALTPADAL